jgi:hypothetical protein
MNDRAAVVTTAIMQMIATAPKGQSRQAIEAYLRDEFEDVARHNESPQSAGFAAGQFRQMTN